MTVGQSRVDQLTAIATITDDNLVPLYDSASGQLKYVRLDDLVTNLKKRVNNTRNYAQNLLTLDDMFLGTYSTSTYANATGISVSYDSTRRAQNVHWDSAASGQTAGLKCEGTWDLTDVTHISIDLGNEANNVDVHFRLFAITDTGSTFTNYFQSTNWIGSSDNKAPRQAFIFTKSDFTTFASADWSNIRRFEIRAAATDVWAGALDFYVYGIYAGNARPKVILSFDDNTPTHYTELYAGTAQTNTQDVGIKCTLYVNGANIDQSGYLTTTQLDTLYAAGWDICNHAYTHTDLTSITVAAAQALLDQNESLLESNGWTRAYKHMAWVGGQYNSDLIDSVTTNGFLTARCVDNWNSPNLSLISTHTGLNMPYTIPIFYLTNTVGSTEALAVIDEAIRLGMSIHLYGHKLVASPSAATEFDRAEMGLLLEGLASRRNSDQCDIVTISEWYNGL